MSLAIALLCAVSTPPTDDSAVHDKYLRVHKEWLHRHEAADAKTQLVVDPREHAMWIEDNGDIDGKHIAHLPRGFQWYAFHVTQEGIVERSFPVRLSHPRRDVKHESHQESLLVIGLSKNSSYQLTFSASRYGTGFHVGTGSKIAGAITIPLPRKPNAVVGQSFRSFVVPQSPITSQPQEAIDKGHFAIRIARRPDRPSE